MNSVADYIPQKAPFVMIGEILFADESKAVTQTLVSEQYLFVEEGCWQVPGLIENVAQTAAAHSGKMAEAHKKPVPIGFIGAVQKIKVYDLPLLNERVTTTIQIKNQVFDVTLIQGTIASEARKILFECDMKIFIQPNK